MAHFKNSKLWKVHRSTELSSSVGLSCDEDSEEWEEFLKHLSTLDEEARRPQFDQKFKDVVRVYKELDNRIQVMRNGLKKNYFNSVISCRDLIREGGMLQHKLQRKTESKLLLLDKLQVELKEDMKIFRVLKEFKSTYAKSKQEVERRSKFDYLIVGFLRVFLRLAKEENTMRKKFLKEWSSLLPQSFCSFLTNCVSEQMIKQLELYFINDTSIEDFDSSQVSALLNVQRQLEREDIALALRDLLEEYMTCSEALSPIHQTLAFALNSECELTGLNITKRQASQEAKPLPQRFSLKIRPEDLEVIDASKTFLHIEGKEAEKYLSFNVEIQDYIEDADGLSLIARSLTQQCSPSSSENSSFMLLSSQA